MSKTLLIAILFIWGIPSTYFRNKFRKIVYKTDDWKINIKPLFKKELIGLFSNLYPSNKEYIKTRDYYRIYLFVYIILFLVYIYLDEINSFL
jgi:peroxiredoxin Q/BCP